MKTVQTIIKERLKLAIKNKDFNGLENLELLINKVLDKPNNLVMMGDAYKYSHHSFYEDGTTNMYSYLESRGGKFDRTVFFGLQFFLKEFLEGVAITQEELDEASDYLGTKHGIFGREDIFDKSKFQYIIDKHQGKLPIRIMAVPEGMVIDTKNVLMTIENTDPNCFWLTNFLETLLLQVWYPITVATLSREIRKIVMERFTNCTSYDIDTINSIIDFSLNDFGFRGVSSVQSARNGGAAHLVNFLGSDNTIASKGIKNFYNSDRTWGLSIPATEHSIMTIKGEKGELEMMKRVLTKYPTGMVACVSDSYDHLRACSEYWGTELKEMILSRPSEPGNQLVIRPDSGHIIQTLIKTFEILFDKFGFTVNEKGYKVLPPQIRVIQGDGVNINSIIEVLDMLEEYEISPENLVFGMGGKLLQAEINRDTQKFATKASSVIVNGEERDVVKSPTEIDENGNKCKSFKKSKKGRLKLVYDNVNKCYKTITSNDPSYNDAIDILHKVFENGGLYNETTFEDVRNNAMVNITEFDSIKLKY